MIDASNHRKHLDFHSLKLVKKKRLTKNSYQLIFEVPKENIENYVFLPGQYATFKWQGETKDFSFASSPLDSFIEFGVKTGSEKGFAYRFCHQVNEGERVEISLPRGRFVLPSKPNEKRIILGFASGIGITPILSHLKFILQTEPLSRFFLFYGEKDEESFAFKNDIEELAEKFSNQFFVYYFYSRQKVNNAFLEGRLNAKKVELIINQILGQDEEDEESTLWDATDEVLICGPGPMIKSIANVCYENGIRKKNIHFELFEEFNEDIFKVEKKWPEIKNVKVDFRLFGQKFSNVIEDNETRILNSLLNSGYKIPYSCKSGICGTCQCKLEKGKVYMVQDEYLTENERKNGMILPCVSVALSKDLVLNFDEI